jgi:cell division protein ZapA (FtsZ GTPase activity inhibitor)
MSEVSIKVNIAGRIYPLTVSEREEAEIRRAEQAIEESIQVFQKNYAVKDKQDLLAMAALQMAAKSEKKPETRIEKVVERVEVPADYTSELLQIEAQLDELLK